MSRYGNWNVMLRLEGIQRRVTKIIKRLKDYSYKERLKKCESINLLEIRIRGDLTEAFKIITEISNYGRHLFNFSPEIGSLLIRQILKIKSTKWIFLLIVSYIFGIDYIIRSKTAMVLKILSLNLIISEKNGKKKNFREPFWKLSDELPNRI